MKIYVVNAKSAIKYFILAMLTITAIFLIGSRGMKAVTVFKAARELPIYSVEMQQKKAAITFDCAWGASDIPDILNTLKNADIKATFFIVGQWAEKYPETVKMIADAGHDVANHSYSHLRMGAVDKNRVKSEIIKCSEVLNKLTGKNVDLFRAPYGDYNSSLITTASELGHYTIQWDVDSLDWKPGISREDIINRINSRIQPGSIILFHNDTPHTAKILPEIILSLKQKGYEFLPVSEMILRDNYYMDHDGKQKRMK